jgi:hypothetical protein
MEDKKKLAAISAVVSMLNSEETSTYVEKVPPHQPSEWTIYGRQQTMNYRDMLQRGFIRRNK